MADADVIVFNTCCVRESAETHILGNLGCVSHIRNSRISSAFQKPRKFFRFVRVHLATVCLDVICIKEKKPSRKVAVCGCMTQATDAAKRLKKRCPFVDIVIGTHNIYKLAEYLKDTNGGAKIVDIWDDDGGITEGVPVKRLSKLSF